MNIKPINIHSSCFRADKDHFNPQTGEYNDPLMHWPIRGAAFTNEIGEALRPVIGGYATLSWAPALLYIGADVYDKYKNNKTEYSPDSRRGLKQAIFQGLASVFLPLIAVKTGQNLFSMLGVMSEDKITINSKEHIIKLARNFVENGRMRKYQHDEEACKQNFLDIFNNALDYKKQVDVTNNPIKKLWLYVEDKFSNAMNVNKKDNLDKFAQKTIENMITLRKNLLNPSEDIKSTKDYQTYQNAMKKGQTSNVAIKSTLNNVLEKNALKGKFIKTCGGFLALGLAISPIDHFVENVLIEKYVAPKLNRNKNA